MFLSSKAALGEKYPRLCPQSPFPHTAPTPKVNILYSNVGQQEGN